MQTSLYEFHRSLHARVTDFHGWEMPLFYTSIVDEHKAVRQDCGIFDVSHMGRIQVAGHDAASFLDRLLTRSSSSMKPATARYGFICDERGGVIDDLIWYRRAEQDFLLVVNASNREIVLNWIQSHKAGEDVHIVDTTFETGILAVQGPEAEPRLQSICEASLSAIRRFRCADISVAGRSAMISRTGYTGEDGFEIYASASDLGEVWSEILKLGAKPCGLGARDTLRLEAALPLYGNELSRDTTPVQAGLEWALEVEGQEFIGAEALAGEIERGPVRKLVGLVVPGKKIPRKGCALLREAQQIGEVTSGGFSPTLGKNIALGYVASEHSAKGSTIGVEIRGQVVEAEIVSLPFYRRKK